MAKSKRYMTGMWITIIGGIVLIIATCLGIGAPLQGLRFMVSGAVQILFILGFVLLLVGGTIWGFADSE